QVLSRAREYCGSARASAWSKRRPAASRGMENACARNSPTASAVGGPAARFAILRALIRREATEGPFLDVPCRSHARQSGRVVYRSARRVGVPHTPRGGQQEGYPGSALQEGPQGPRILRLQRCHQEL